MYQKEEHKMDRRRLLQMAAGTIGMLGAKSEALAQTYSAATRGLPPLKITKVKTIQTCFWGLYNNNNFVFVIHKTAVCRFLEY